MYHCIRISLILLFFYTNALDAQVNLKVGYGTSYQNLETTNKILQTYNEQNPWLETNFKEAHYFQSLILGLRYQWEFVGLELTWQKGFNRKKAEGISPLTNATIKKTLVFHYDAFSLGYENYYRNIGIGASLDYNRYVAKSEINKEGKQRINNQENFSSHFYLSYTFNNNSDIKFMIKPYIQIPWTQIELNDFAQNLNQDSTDQNFTENTMSYGLMLIFYHGN